MLQLSQTNYSVDEGAGRATLTVVRTGDVSGTATVDYATADSTPLVRCDTATGTASNRCDYATTLDTVRFAAGEREQSLVVPITDDSFVEGAEALAVTLSHPTGASLGDQKAATLTINDNDASVTGPNPIDSTAFFVRQQYLDFLSREPEPDGDAAWQRVLTQCSDVNNNPICDRITVSAAFFASDEFQFKGYFVYRFYQATLGRMPKYAEIIPDMRRVTGQTGEEVIAKRDQFAGEWLERAAFKTLYDNTTNEQFVDKLLRTAGITTVTVAGTTQMRDDLIGQLTAAAKTRADVVRAVVESQEVNRKEYNGAFVAMQYFGYLRRDPEKEGYQAWLRVINADPQDRRTMVNGFVNSTEYRLRFGQP